jgi:site-specific DNA recombinase
MANVATSGLRVAIYARVSTEEQREGQTIDSQIAELERFAADRQLQITHIYKDEGWSGGVMARPELDHLRDNAQKGLQAVLINDVDRLARDVTHLGVIKRDLERGGIQVIFRKLPSDSSPTHNLMINILGSFAEFERELISDRTRRGRRHKVEVRKKYLGSLTSYGYRYTPIDRAAGQEGFLEIIPSEAFVVRQIFEWVDREGLSAHKVLRRLNERRIPPRKRGRTWAKSSVLRILRNEMYAGVWYYNKHESCEPTHASIERKYRKHVKSSIRRRRREDWLPVELPKSLVLVPRDRWERVQRQITQNITFSPRNEKYTYLLKGLVRCAGCGSRYIGDPCHGKRYYRCIASDRGVTAGCLKKRRRVYLEGICHFKSGREELHIDLFASLHP